MLSATSRNIRIAATLKTTQSLTAILLHRTRSVSSNNRNVGEVFSQNLVKTAEIADKITVVRSMTHGEADHDRGTHNMFTGYRPSPALQFPSMGSVVSHEFGSRKNLPPYVCIPGQPTSSRAPAISVPPTVPSASAAIPRRASSRSGTSPRSSPR